MRYQTTGEELEQYLAKSDELLLVGDYGKGDHREVKYHVPTGEYRVYDHRELNLATTDPTVAATEFNGIRPR